MKLIKKFLQTFIFVVLLAYPSYAQIDFGKAKETYKEVLSLYPNMLIENALSRKF